MDLQALEEIRTLKYRYFRTLDLKQWDDFAATLDPEIEARYGTHVMGKELVFDSREAVVEFMRNNTGPSIVTTHVANHPEIVVDGDTATGSWLFEDTVIATEFNVLIRGSGYYTDRYRKGADGIWRIAATSYVRIYESSQSLADTPSHTLISNMWAPVGDK